MNPIHAPNPAGQVTEPLSPLASALLIASTAASAYHGYKRNNGSVGWSIGWGLLGSLFPIITPIVAVAQGYAEPQRRPQLESRLRSRSRSR